MIKIEWLKKRHPGKGLLSRAGLARWSVALWTSISTSTSILILFAGGGCSVNPATGERQFTALLPAAQEARIGAQEHAKVQKLFGDFVDGDLSDYVNGVAQKIAAQGERGDVAYRFFVLDSPEVNAFALPGGYIYVTRGLLALANSEAEMAAVIAHEIGHITARHSAERLSQGALVGLGAAILSAALDSPVANDVVGLGADLYIKSYSREQEHQADDLGIRYLGRAGYDTHAMSRFLDNLQRATALDREIAGQAAPPSILNYFSTHPQTQDRVVRAATVAGQYLEKQQGRSAGRLRRDAYFEAIDGLVYGDSAQQGFARGRDFYHPQMGFAFTVPQGFEIDNRPGEVVATHQSGALILFDSARDESAPDPLAYLTRTWMRGEPLANPEAITINGIAAATAAFQGQIGGRDMTIRIVAIGWEPGRFFRFQMAVPRGADAAFIEELKRTTYSFRRLTMEQKRSIRPYRLKIVTTGPGSTLAELAARIPYRDYQERRLRVLNGLGDGQDLTAGERYKTIAE